MTHLAGVVSKLDEAEALELAGLAVGRQAHVSDLARLAEERRQGLAHRVLALAAVEALDEHVVVVTGRPCMCGRTQLACVW